MENLESLMKKIISVKRRMKKEYNPIVMEGYKREYNTLIRAYKILDRKIYKY